MITLDEAEVQTVCAALRAASASAKFRTMAEFYSDLATVLSMRATRHLTSHETVTAISALLKAGEMNLSATLSDRSAEDAGA